MSRKTNCLDNAAIESLFATIKTECFYLNRFDTAEQLQQVLDRFIHYYSHQHIKLKLNDLSSVQCRTQVLGL